MESGSSRIEFSRSKIDARGNHRLPQVQHQPHLRIAFLPPTIRIVSWRGAIPRGGEKLMGLQRSIYNLTKNSTGRPSVSSSSLALWMQCRQAPPGPFTKQVRAINASTPWPLYEAGAPPVSSHLGLESSVGYSSRDDQISQLIPTCISIEDISTLKSKLPDQRAKTT